MNEMLPIFDDQVTTLSPSSPETVTASQRQALKSAFEKLGVRDARAQFRIVEELTGQRIEAVRELESRHAQTLIHRLADRVNSVGRINTGNAWDDREADTWIDNL